MVAVSGNPTPHRAVTSRRFRNSHHAVPRTIRQRRPRWALAAVTMWLVALLVTARAQPRPVDRPRAEPEAQTFHGRVVADNSGSSLRNAVVAITSDGKRTAVVTDAEG